MNLNILWFVLIAVLYIGFFLLEGFDFGVGILLPFLSRDKNPEQVDANRRMILNTIGPHWDANEVWLITAGGATFAAFPNWYATLFSGFYLALFLLLLALIVRGVAIEFRSKEESPRWRKVWDWSFFLGSAIPALLLGVTFANLMRGVPIDQNMNYTGGFFNLLNPYALLAGIASLFTFTLYGAIFLSLKTPGELRERASAAARRLWLPVVILLFALLAGTYIFTDFSQRLGIDPGLIPITGMAAILVAGYFIRKRMDGWAFAMTATSIAFAMVTVFRFLFPRVMVSSLDEAYSLTIYNAASNPYTLKVMTIVTLIFLPFVLIYQAWSYWVFRKRVSADVHELTY